MNRKKERREVAKALKHTKLSLPVRFRLAKFFVDGYASGFGYLPDLLKHIGLKQIEFKPGCQCCGDHTFIYADDKKGRLVVRYNGFNSEVEKGRRLRRG